MAIINQVLSVMVVILFTTAAIAQVSLYGQCGGQSYTGSTTCVSGAICQFQNAYYYQCVQGTATSVTSTSTVGLQTSSTAKISSASSKTTTTSTSTLITSTVKVQTSSTAKISSVLSTKTTTTTSAAASTSSVASSGTKYLMIFGDSYSSDGYYPGGAPPSSTEPLGVYPPGTTTDGGLNWVGVTATKLNTTLTLAFDFAEYGATTDNSLVNGATHDFIGQVNEFQTYTAHNASNIPWTSSNTMAIVWLGINDVGNPFQYGYATPFNSILDVYFQRLQILYNAGIKYFTLFLIPPFDQNPTFAQQTVQEKNYLRSNITTYNEDLVTRFATFKSANSGVIGTIFNTSASFWTVLNNPTAYGAPDATCTNSDGTSCLWWDNYHPGQAIQKLVAQNFVNALKGTFF